MSPKGTLTQQTFCKSRHKHKITWWDVPQTAGPDGSSAARRGVFPGKVPEALAVALWVGGGPASLPGGGWP